MKLLICFLFLNTHPPSQHTGTHPHTANYKLSYAKSCMKLEFQLFFKLCPSNKIYAVLLHTQVN